MAQYPDIVVAASGDGEVELAYSPSVQVIDHPETATDKAVLAGGHQDQESAEQRDGHGGPRVRSAAWLAGRRGARRLSLFDRGEEVRALGNRGAARCVDRNRNLPPEPLRDRREAPVRR